MRRSRAPLPAERTPPRGPSAGPSSRSRLLVLGVLSAWSRVVLAIVLSAVLAGAAGLGELAGYAVIPGVYLALSPPVGRLWLRTGTVAVATVLIAGMVALGAELSRSTAAVTVGLAVVGFGTGLLTRAGPRAAAVSWPLLMGFAYSAGQPLADASAGSRGAAVLVALPAYVLAAGVVLLGDQRRPVTLGAAAALGGVARALGLVAAGVPGAAAEADSGLLRFRLATARLKDAALPLGRSPDSRAALLLAASTHRAVSATEFLAADPSPGVGRRQSIPALAKAAAELAAALAQRGTPPPIGPIEQVAAEAGEERDLAVAMLAGSLAGVGHATDVLQGRTSDLPAGMVGELPGALTRLRATLRLDDPVFRRSVRLGLACATAGAVAGLLQLGRTYWVVFAVVVILNAPAAQDSRRALLRLAGTVAGFGLSIPLVALTNGDKLAGLTLGLLLLLIAILLMAVNYGVAVLFITAAVGTLFSIGADAQDFVSYRVVDNLVGAGVVLVIGTLVFHTRPADWWRSARVTATMLADAAAAPEPRGHRDELVLQVMRLRAETAEAAALPGAASQASAEWIYVTAAEDLVRILTGPNADPVDDPAGLATRLRAVAERAYPDGTRQPQAPVPSGLAEQEVARMDRSVTALRER